MRTHPASTDMTRRLAGAGALALASLLSACVVCDRPTEADGVYLVTSDCGGPLVEGELTIGGNGGALVEKSAGAGLDACGETIALGGGALGLPSRVRVNGPGDFELYGDVNGRTLSCAPEIFGDEGILLCRQDGRLVCAAAISLP